MSKQGLASAIGLATLDKTFRDSLLDDPARAIHEANFDLDSSEIEFF